jgi:hypothetical protein
LATDSLEKLEGIIETKSVELKFLYALIIWRPGLRFFYGSSISGEPTDVSEKGKDNRLHSSSSMYVI